MIRHNAGKVPRQLIIKFNVQNEFGIILSDAITCKRISDEVKCWCEHHYSKFTNSGQMCGKYFGNWFNLNDNMNWTFPKPSETFDPDHILHDVQKSVYSRRNQKP